MQEIFEKIKERLQEYIEEYSDLDENGLHSERWCAMQEALASVNQVAEEYNQSLANNNQSLTNGDKIRNMTDEELAVLLFRQTHCDYCNIRTKCRQIDADNCHDVFLVWLQSKAEE